MNPNDHPDKVVKVRQESVESAQLLGVNLHWDIRQERRKKHPINIS